MSQFRFSVGPWNVHTGADSYGPETRKAIDLETKFANFKKSASTPSSSMTTTRCRT